MSHQDTFGHTPSDAHHQDLKAVLDWLLDRADCSAVKFRDVCTWTPRGLIATALLWAWSGETALTERFAAARSIAVTTLDLGTLTATTYQAFLKLVRAWSATLAAVLTAALRRRMREDLAERFLVAGYAAFGVDGTRLELPRSASNQNRFAARAKSKSKPKPRHTRTQTQTAHLKKADNPQLWLTVMWHVGAGLPWDWRLEPSGSSERDHLRQMIAALPDSALVIADAGFVGYETWKAILKSGRHLLIRVGANVRLLKNLGYAKETSGLVYLWPDREAARKQPPLVLRLVVAQGGRHPVYLVTSVLETKRLSNKQVVEIYALRWGIELFHRHFKQTFGRRKLRSQRGENAEVEAIWSLLGLWALGLHAQVELARDGVAADRVSVAGVLRAYRGSMRDYRDRPGPGESLWERLSGAVIDDYERSNKASRDYPRKKRAEAIGAPEIRDAMRFEIEIAQQIKHVHGKWLTA